ncbi:MAG TPA: hypothetical protein VK957_08545 [Lunatimonas sp.]|nr:hypothetical protein [Lunatimonas sp.]
MPNQPKNFIASVEPSERFQIQIIAGKLKDKGCQIRNILTITGIITGCTSGVESSLDELKIDGIQTIEEDREVGAI